LPRTVFFFVQGWFLEEDSHGVAGAEPGLTVGGGVQSGHDLQDGGLTGTVRAHNTDLGAGKKDMLTSSRMSFSPTALRALVIV
jgi:hypothetical protein